MATTYLTRTPSSSGNRKTWTFSAWFKRSKIAAGQKIFCVQGDSSNLFECYFNSNDTLAFYHYSSNGGVTDSFLGTNQVFRDVNAWYHLVLEVDTTQATASNRVKMYVNGEQVTSFSSASYFNQNYDTYINWTYEHRIGANLSGALFFNGSMSHIHLIDGTAYDASAFGSTDSTTGEWKINTSPSVTYGTNGFFILKDGNSVTDSSTNSNNFTVGGGTLTKTEDCPSNVFNTFNYYFGAGNQNLLNGVGGYGGTQFSSGSTSSECFVVGNLAFNSGKYYWEWKAISEHPEANFWGIADIDQLNGIGNGNIVTNNKSYVWGGSQGNKFNGGNDGSYGSQIDINNIGMVAVDMDNNKIWLGENGTWFASGNPATGANPMYSNLSGTITPFHSDDYSTYTPSAYYNFGNGYFGTTAVSSAGTNASEIGIFEYDVPTGYTALSTKGLNT